MQDILFSNYSVIIQGSVDIGTSLLFAIYGPVSQWGICVQNCGAIGEWGLLNCWLKGRLAGYEHCIRACWEQGADPIDELGKREPVEKRKKKII